jgi:CRISPR/Cas system-associated exonuclease Cas4 (RecB family)
MTPVYVWEIKTTSEDLSLAGVYWRRLTIDFQVSTYLAAARSLGYDAIAVLYDALRKPAHRPMATKNETPEAYGRRVLEAITEDPERYYRRGLVTRLESELDEARVDTWQTAVAIRDSKRLKVFPRNPDACVQWSRVCDYFAVCCGEQSIDDPLLFRKNESKHVELDASEVDGLELLTQSSLRTYRSCPRKYYYRYELQMRPLKAEAEPLRQGKSVHAALEAWSKSGGDIEFALTCLDKEDSFAYAKEAAMVTGYHARWEKPTGVIAVEKEWQMELVNPETGAASRTFRLAGRMDKLVEVPAIEAPTEPDPDCECPDCLPEEVQT